MRVKELIDALCELNLEMEVEVHVNSDRHAVERVVATSTVALIIGVDHNRDGTRRETSSLSNGS